MTRKETVGDRIKRLRHERGLSQREIASPGVSYGHISRIEVGERQPSMKALRRIAEKLGVSVDYLETGEDAIRLRLPAGIGARERSEMERVLQERLDRIVAKVVERG